MLLPEYQFSDFEKYLLRLPVPSIDLPALPDTADSPQYFERAAKIAYGEITPVGEHALVDILCVLGAVPASQDEINIVCGLYDAYEDVT